MKQVLIRSGKIVVEEVPAPQVQAGGVLVRVLNSCISAGTEAASLGDATGPIGLVQRAMKHPERVKAVIEMARDRGIRSTVATVRGELEYGAPTGYSVAGVVEAVGAGITDLAVGDRVACAGAGLANHAEYVAVPRNLTAKLPAGLGTEAAATVTLGAIAMHGVRRLEPTLGEWFVVIGLGLLGQLTVQLLRANGCRVIGVDLNPERIALALSLGMEEGAEPDEIDAVERIRRLTGGHGADGVIITAASPSDEILSTAFQMCRKKGRVVVVGDVGLSVQRADIFPREIEFRIATSYGPGRYDPRYEEQGLDYPIGYVRWTENRNMQEYLQMLSEGKIELRPLLARVFPLAEAPAAYEFLGTGPAAPFVLLSYPQPEGGGQPVARRLTMHHRPSARDRIRVGVIGAGTFARGVHLPNLQRLADQYEIRAIMSRTGPTAKRVAGQFGAAYAATDADELLDDRELDAVIITTRHNLHAGLALTALRAGKHVLVEKPLALTPTELEEIEGFFRDAESSGHPTPILLTGFNRRFSPAARVIREHLEKTSNPAILNYRMNAGYIPPEHWVHGTEGGGRNIGEACHVYDLFLYLLDAKVTRVVAGAIQPRTGYYSRNDNFVATLDFEDGSLATLTYTALGNKEWPKERLEVYADGVVAALDDYRKLEFFGARRRPVASRQQDKGHFAELEAFARAIREGGAWPIPLWQQLEATRVSFAAEKQIGALTAIGSAHAEEVEISTVEA